MWAGQGQAQSLLYTVPHGKPRSGAWRSIVGTGLAPVLFPF